MDGANGSLNTNYLGKAQAALDALLKQDQDFVYIHVEAPDEMGHQGNVQHKVQSIERIDKQVVKVVKEGLDAAGVDYRLLIMPDHPTPIRCRTHTSDPVPYILYDSTVSVQGPAAYTEFEAKNTGRYQPHAHLLIDELIGGK